MPFENFGKMLQKRSDSKDKDKVAVNIRGTKIYSDKRMKKNIKKKKEFLDSMKEKSKKA